MSRLLLTGLATILLAGPVSAAEPPKSADLTMVVQDGTVVGRLNPDDEDAWLAAAQQMANRRQESVVVLQGQKFICLLNPERKVP